VDINTGRVKDFFGKDLEDLRFFGIWSFVDLGIAYDGTRLG